MEASKRAEMIRRMIHPNVTVPSLAMYAGRMARDSFQALCEFLEVSCENDISKTAALVHLPLEPYSEQARAFVLQILTERCRTPERFTHLDLLAIGVFGHRQLLREVSGFFTEKLLRDAFALADVKLLSWLLSASFVELPQEHCALVRSAFCAAIFTNNSRMDAAVTELLPLLVEYGAADVLSALIEIAGIEKVQALYGRDLFPVADQLIRADRDSLPLWEICFDRFFSQPHTPEEMLVEGLWHVQMYAGEEIYEDVCALFYFYVAIHCGVEHPVFAHIGDCVPPAEHSHRHALRYKDAVDERWDQPEALARFLEKTAICNPYEAEWVQDEEFTLVKSEKDPLSYRKLTRLFDAQASAAAILKIFFATELRQNLPLEDLFYLAQRYERLPELLDALKGVSFPGIVTKQRPRALLVSPLSYFSTNLHMVNLTYQTLEKEGHEEARQKGREIQYNIVSFRNGFIKTVIYEEALPSAQEEAATSWGEAVQALRDALRQPEVPAGQLRQLALKEFTLDSFTRENDLNLLTHLIRDNPDRLPVFLDALVLCKWNLCFGNDRWKLKKQVYDDLRQYYEPVLELFETLFASGQSEASILELYFSSIYKAILPLNRLLAMADPQRLAELLPGYIIYCRLPAEDSTLCRPMNILCGSVCSVDSAEGLSVAEPFAATITEFIVRDSHAFRITLTPYRVGETTSKKRGEMFGYLARNIDISNRRASLIAAFPGTEQYDYREIVFNLACMENALKLRRSDGAALGKLLQVLGNANPFRFQLSPFADRIYLKKFRGDTWRRGNVLDTATIMMLNAEDMAGIRDLYLHTDIKFYLHLPNLAKLICQRRGDLAERLPELFEGVEFHAIADSQGMLCMPWVAQNVLRVGRQYAGMLLRLALSLNRDGQISLTVLQAEPADQAPEFYDIWAMCRLMGYRDRTAMEAYTDRTAELDALLASRNAPDAQVLPFPRTVELLGRLVQDPDMNPDDFGREICRMIRLHHETVPQQDMEAAIAALTEAWLLTVPKGQKLSGLLFGIHKSFAGKYGAASLGQIFCSQCHRYADSRVAVSFEKAVRSLDLVRQPEVPQTTETPEELPQTTEMPEAVTEIPEAPESVTEAPEEIPQALETPREMIAEVPGAAARFGKHLKRVRILLLGGQEPSHSIIKELGKLVRMHFREISAATMEEAIAPITEELMKADPTAAQMKQALLGLHNSYYKRYRSNALGVTICRQARQYLSNGVITFLEGRILKTKAAPDAGAGPEKEKPPKPDFAQRVGQLRSLMEDPQEEPEAIARELGRTIRDYRDTVDRQEMLLTMAALTEAFILRYSDGDGLRQCLSGIHESFANHYRCVDLGLVICLQGYQHLEFYRAGRLESHIRASKGFRLYAEPEMLFDYFMDRERIPSWKEICYTT